MQKVSWILRVFSTGVDVQGVVQYFDVKMLFECALDVEDTGIAKLENFAIVQYNMVVLAGGVARFELGQAVFELVFSNQTGFHEQLDGIVQSCPADLAFGF